VNKILRWGHLQGSIQNSVASGSLTLTIFKLCLLCYSKYLFIEEPSYDAATSPPTTALISMQNLTEIINNIMTIQLKLKIYMLLVNLLILSKTDQLFF